MRAFFRTSSGEANEAASRVAHAVASNASSSVEQPVEAFVSIEAVNRWLNSRDELPSSLDFERLRAAVVVLTSKHKPRKEDVRPLCVSWNVRTWEHNKSRPLATLIKELQQAVLAECSKLRGSLDVLPGASASSTVQLAGPVLVSGSATNSEQLVTTSTAGQSRVKRLVETGSAAQPGRRVKARPQGAQSVSSSVTITEAVQSRDDDPGDGSLLPLFQEEQFTASVCVPKTKQRRLTDMFSAADSLQGEATASSSSSSFGINTSTTSAA